ncbi:subclass B3 metallo-beta-lactamase [Massilia sp. CF038]|uniref:subclass B3 metallo-beta-lactamase n=1 Tax=Massilia sp. CF038 TaxID=1881045 RepID=UPI00091BAFEC|nr:subclass B3 metallo-beta-lactamase [Massilia sp. CF038]SHH61450.1 metallo-beta-lactamase class B [Massilia sp. CF038]
MAFAHKLAWAAALTLACQGGQAAPADQPITEFNCSSCKEWNAPQKPFNIYGNTWYVGTAELSALLITSPKGHILLDGALPQSAPLIEKNIKALGFKLKDVKLIVNSHEHFDHAGGIAALQRRSGAIVAASAIGARVLQAGVIGKDDLQYQPDQDPRIDKVPKVQVVGEGETLAVGGLALTAHMTPGHAPGGTTWTWTSCEHGRCLDMVYADSLTPVSADSFRFTEAPAAVAALRASIAKVAALKCDVVVSTHPGFTDVMAKLQARKGDTNPFIDAEGCRNYAAGATKRLDERLASESANGALPKK